MNIEIEVPEGKSGIWAVETIEVTQADSDFSRIRAMMDPHDYCPPGFYKRLTRGGTVVMSNTPMEVDTNRPIIRRATGRVLINGLGLGMVLTAILRRPDVFDVTVVEKSTDVITLVGPTFSVDSRVKIYNADALSFTPPKGVRYNAVWHDIWDNVCSDNLPEMKTLHRKYGRRCDWQGSWCRHECAHGRFS